MARKSLRQNLSSRLLFITSTVMTVPKQRPGVSALIMGQCEDGRNTGRSVVRPVSSSKPRVTPLLSKNPSSAICGITPLRPVRPLLYFRLLLPVPSAAGSVFIVRGIFWLFRISPEDDPECLQKNPNQPPPLSASDRILRPRKRSWSIFAQRTLT